MKLTRSEHMLFALLKGSLNNTAVVHEEFESASAQDWEQCCAIAAKQGVLALAWEGVQSLTKDLQPPKQLKFKWATWKRMETKKYIIADHCFEVPSSLAIAELPMPLSLRD